jgi:sterol desaturase/sphingolipid hydroxylase (fatty acid hydroxylase superfamily)
MLANYGFWLGIVSFACLLLERIMPWRKEQRMLRPEIAQDLFWFLFNGYTSYLVFAGLFAYINVGLDFSFLLIFKHTASSFKLISAYPLWLQIFIFLIVSDFLEWCIHNILHRVGPFWKFHRVHHSIIIMDWIGNFRFHWVETILYTALKYLPLAVLNAGWETMLICAVISTTIGHLNHSNLNISWGPLRYILNSPRMHIWHHEKHKRGKSGVNFAVVFSFWDWVFNTAYMPSKPVMPESIGFANQNKVSSSIVMRFFLPFV